MYKDGSKLRHKRCIHIHGPASCDPHMYASAGQWWERERYPFVSPAFVYERGLQLVGLTYSQLLAIVINIFHTSNTLNWEISVTNNICDFCELTSLAISFVSNIPAHVPKYRYRQCMVRLANILVANFSAYQIWRRFTKFTVCESFPI